MSFTALYDSLITFQTSSHNDNDMAVHIAKTTASHEEAMLLEEPISEDETSGSWEDIQSNTATTAPSNVDWPTLPQPIIVEGVTLQESTTLNDTTLYRNGHGVRTVRAPFGYNLHVYVATLYTERPVRTEQDVQALFDDNNPQPFVLEFTFLRDVSPSQMSIAWNYQLDSSVTASDYENYQDDRTAFLELLDGSMVQGGKLRCDFGVDRMVLTNQGQPAGEIEGTDFSKAFCSMWFGEQPVMEEIKVGLLKGASAEEEEDAVEEGEREITQVDTEPIKL